jgi:hypothetical protein
MDGLTLFKNTLIFSTILMLVSKRGVYYYDRINPPPINYLWCINMNLFTNIKYYKLIKKSKNHDNIYALTIIYTLNGGLCVVIKSDKLFLLFIICIWYIIYSIRFRILPRKLFSFIAIGQTHLGFRCTIQQIWNLAKMNDLFQCSC